MLKDKDKNILDDLKDILSDIINPNLIFKQYTPKNPDEIIVISISGGRRSTVALRKIAIQIKIRSLSFQNGYRLSNDIVNIINNIYRYEGDAVDITNLVQEGEVLPAGVDANGRYIFYLNFIANVNKNIK